MIILLVSVRQKQPKKGQTKWTILWRENIATEKPKENGQNYHQPLTFLSLGRPIRQVKEIKWMMKTMTCKR
jgi:hypothetical protein